MVAHRRGGRPSGVVGRKKQRAPPRRRSQSTSDENSSDGGSITRCICGETHNVGLMVQCDKCEVWQHCECMGLEQPDIPDHYYCEQCKPEDHKNLGGRTNRQHVAAAAAIVKAPKKRMTLNSREASMSLEDVLAARSALEMYESHMDGDSPQSTPSSPHHLNDTAGSLTQSHDEPSYATVATTISPKDQHDNNMTIRQNGDMAVKPAKRKREIAIKLPDTIEEKSEPPSSTVSSVGHEELFIFKEQEEFPESDRMTTPKQSTSTTTPPINKPKRKQAKQSEKKVNGRLNGRTHGGGGGKRGKPRSRTSTPVRESSPFAAVNELDDEGKDSPEDIISSIVSGYFSPTARALSPPAKTRQPHARMSISEMNRRANQILEYISSIQVEMASKENDHRAGHGVNTSFAKFTATNHLSSMTTAVVVEEAEEQMRDDDDNDSLSSASTIPLIRDAEDDDDVSEPLDEQTQSSMDIMDKLTRKLIKFQRRFGSRNRALYEEALTEGEGRVTRSREASGNMNIYRNMMAH